VHGYWYATSATWLKQEVQHGHDVLLEIDWQGAQQVRRLIPEAVHIFILPPSLGSLKERLEKRGQDAPDVIARRLDAAREEMRHCGEFDYVIMNQDFARAVDDLSTIVRAARLTATRQQVRHAALIAQLLNR
jgi:guanylate kinase